METNGYEDVVAELRQEIAEAHERITTLAKAMRQMNEATQLLIAAVRQMNNTTVNTIVEHLEEHPNEQWRNARW